MEAPVSSGVSRGRASWARSARRPAVFALLCTALLSSAARSAEPFTAAGISYEEAGTFLRQLREAVTAHNATAVAALTQFPLTVNGKPGPKDAAEFAQQFDAIYTGRVRAAVLTQSVDTLFANWHGLMVGRGEVWISALCDDHGPPDRCRNRRILVVSVNN